MLKFSTPTPKPNYNSGTLQLSNSVRDGDAVVKCGIQKALRVRTGNAVRSSFILRTTYPQSSVTPPLAGPSGRRPPGMWRSPSRPPAVVVDLA